MPPIQTFPEAKAAVADGVDPAEAARQLVAAMTPDEQLWCLDGDLPFFTGMGFITAQDGYHRAPCMAGRLDRLGFEGVAFVDGPRGCVIGNATCFPVSMARGATWDPLLEERVGAAIGAEIAAIGGNLTGAVCINLLRHPAWGRAQETYGEDPHHVGAMGVALTRGLQRHVLACVKHFAANSIENARFKVDVTVDEVALHEIYLPHFRQVVDAGVASVMSAYNKVNGHWCGESEELLTSILRDEWGFEGFVISDFVFGVRHATPSLSAGLDIEMPARMTRYEHLADDLASGEANWDDVTASVERILATFLRFDSILRAPHPPELVGSVQHRALAREVAGRSVVLLRNEPIAGAPVLPLPSESSLAVIGRLGTTVNVGDAGSSDVWDLDCLTVADGARQAFATVTTDDGTDLDSAVAVARQADAALVVVGTTRLDEGEWMGDASNLPTEGFPKSEEPELVTRHHAWAATVPGVTRPVRVEAEGASFGAGGDRTSLRLRPEEVALIRAVAAANPRTVVALQAGSAILGDEWLDDVPAIVQCWYGGAQAGPGLADVLIGTVNPSARMPFSVPADEADLPPFDRDAEEAVYDRWHGWWHLDRIGRTATFPFGFGLSYTTFAQADATAAVSGDEVVVSGTVTNTGSVDGADVVQIYAELPDPEAPKRLVGFARVEVDAATTAPWTVRVPRAKFETRDPAAHAWRPAQGAHRLFIARHAADEQPTELVVDL